MGGKRREDVGGPVMKGDPSVTEPSVSNRTENQEKPRLVKNRAQRGEARFRNRTRERIAGEIALSQMEAVTEAMGAPLAPVWKGHGQSQRGGQGKWSSRDSGH